MKTSWGHLNVTNLETLSNLLLDNPDVFSSPNSNVLETLLLVKFKIENTYNSSALVVNLLERSESAVSITPLVAFTDFDKMCEWTVGYLKNKEFEAFNSIMDGFMIHLDKNTTLYIGLTPCDPLHEYANSLIILN
jgi:LEA14-like dessication related protein